MSVSYCMGKALEIGRTPRASWASQIDQLPDGCSRAECGRPKNCRERIADYLRTQYRVQALRERVEALKKGKAS